MRSDGWIWGGEIYVEEGVHARREHSLSHCFRSFRALTYRQCARCLSEITQHSAVPAYPVFRVGWSLSRLATPTVAG